MNYGLIFGSMRQTITLIASIILVKYFLYLILAPFYPVKQLLWQMNLKKKIKKGLAPKTYKPLVSVIIPAWNEEVGIITTVKSVLNGSYNNTEIIIIDDGSKDNTKKTMRDFIKTYRKKPLDGKTIRYFRQKKAGKGGALNNGVSKAKGEIIVTMDADSVHEKHCLKNIVRHFQDPAIDAVVGNVKIANNNSLVGMIQKLEYIFGFYFKRVHSLFNAEYIYGGACAAFRKATTFDKLGGFDTANKTEDIEYSMRTKFHGLKAVYAEEAITYTEGASDWPGLFKQRVRWKKGRIDTFKKYKKLFFSTDKKHSKFMSWVILPYAVFGEMQILFEPMFFALIWTYTLISRDFLSLGLSSLFIFFTFWAAIVFGDKKTNPLYLMLFPSFWLLFYGIVAVEFFALVKSIDMILSRKDVVWQNWQRQGIQKTAIATT